MEDVRSRIESQVPGLSVEMAQLMEDLIGDLTAVPQPVEIKLFADNPAQPIAAPPAPKKISSSAPADKVVPKNFLKIHALLPSCVSPTPDLSNQHTIKILKFHPAQHRLGANPCCPAGSRLIPSTNAVAIADPKALGSDADYELDAVAPDKIAIYLRASKPPAASRLGILERAIDDLAGTDFNYAEVISVPMGRAKEMASKVSSLNSGGITAVALDGDEGSSILLRGKDDPNPAILDDLKQRIFDLRWQIPIAPSTQRLFHLNATTVVKNLTGSADGAGDKPAADNASASKSASPGGGGDSATSTASPTVSVTLTAPGAPDAAGVTQTDLPRCLRRSPAPPIPKAQTPPPSPSACRPSTTLSCTQTPTAQIGGCTKGTA
jgi:hypothetical protein